MSITLNGKYYASYGLTSPGQKPATIYGLIDVDSSNPFTSGLFGDAGTAWTVANFGTVESVGTQGIGINLGSGGLVVNNPDGYIAGNASGIQIGGTPGDSDTVVNSGTVVAAGGTNCQAIVIFAGSGTVINSGTVMNSAAAGSSFAQGVNLSFGYLSNSGLIAVTGAVTGTGVSIGNGGTVGNLGTISSPTSSNGFGVFLGSCGGLVVNGIAGSPLGLITAYHNGVGISAGTTGNSGTVVNHGLIESTQPGTAAGTGFVGDAININNGPGTVVNLGTLALLGTAGGNAGRRYT